MKMTTSLERFVADALPQEGVSFNQCFQLDFPSLQAAVEYLAQRDRPPAHTKDKNPLIVYGWFFSGSKREMKGPVSMIIEGELFNNPSHAYLITLRPEPHNGNQILSRPDMYSLLQEHISGEAK